jgi:SAM-dependent methyltransferase
VSRIKTAGRRLLEKLGLLGVAFRVQEYFWALKPHDRTAVRSTDGIAVPDAQLIVSVGGHANAAAFLQGGRDIADAIRVILDARGVKLADLGSILDFGCGCGRILRHWSGLPKSVAIYGTDYNKKAIAWCARNLPFVTAEVNRLEPPLRYENDSFDFVYAFSVFTHLSEALQPAWIQELARVMAPGGYLLITVHGESFRSAMTTEERARFDGGDLVVRHSSMAGSNLCAAFHPLRYLEWFSGGLELVEHMPARMGQDAVLWRKRPATFEPE